MCCRVALSLGWAFAERTREGVDVQVGIYPSGVPDCIVEARGSGPVCACGDRNDNGNDALAYDAVAGVCVPVPKDKGPWRARMLFLLLLAGALVLMLVGSAFLASKHYRLRRDLHAITKPSDDFDVDAPLLKVCDWLESVKRGKKTLHEVQTDAGPLRLSLLQAKNVMVRVPDMEHGQHCPALSNVRGVTSVGLHGFPP